MAHPTLHKFPRTVHLVNTGAATRDDLVLSSSDVNHWLQRELICEEKVDGGNLGISLDENWAVRLQKRGHWVTPASEPQYGKLQSWLDLHRQELCDILDWFLVFDIYDVNEGKFYSRAHRERLLSGSSLWSVQHVASRRFHGVQEVLDLLQHLPSAYCTQAVPAEGLVLRVEEGPWLAQRFKVVRAGFQQAIEDGDHWSKRTLLPNAVRPDLWPEPDRTAAADEQDAGPAGEEAGPSTLPGPHVGPAGAAGAAGAEADPSTPPGSRVPPAGAARVAGAEGSTSSPGSPAGPAGVEGDAAEAPPPPRAPEGVSVRWVRGVIALAGPAVDAAAESALELFGDQVPEAARSARRERDGTHYHITLMASAEAKQVMNELSLGRGALLHRVRSLADPAGWVPLALGRCSEAAGSDVVGAATAYYAIVAWPSGCTAREALGLQPAKDFHITLGFQPRDVHQPRKDLRSAVQPPEPQHVSAMLAAAAAAGMGLELPQEAALLLIASAWQLCTSAQHDPTFGQTLEQLLQAATQLLAATAPVRWSALVHGCSLLLRARLAGRDGELEQCMQQGKEACLVLEGSGGGGEGAGLVAAARCYGHQLAAKALYTQGDYTAAHVEFGIARAVLDGPCRAQELPQIPALPADLLQKLVSLDLNADTLARGQQAAAKRMQGSQ